MLTRKNRPVMRSLSLWFFLTFLFVVSPFIVSEAGAAPMNGMLPGGGTTLTVSGGQVTIPLTLVPTTDFGRGTINVVLHFSGVAPPGSLLTAAVYGGTPGGGGAVPPGPTTTTTGTETGWQKYEASTGTSTVYVDPEKVRSLYAAAPKEGVVLVKPPAVLAGGLVPPNVTASLPLDVVNLGGNSTVPSVLDMGAIEMKLPPEAVKSLADAVKKGAGILGSLQVRVQASSDLATRVTLGSLPPQALTNMTPASHVITVSMAAVDPQGKETALSLDKGSVSVSFNPEAVRDPRKVNLYMIGSLVYVGGKVDLANNRVSADLVQLKSGRFVALEYSKTFKDIQAHWAQGNIELMASKYIVQGMTDDEFWPQDPVTRAQFVTLLVRSLGIPEFKPAGATFKDVGSGAWHYGYVEAAYKAGLTTGDNGKGGLFRPGDTISRQEMAAMLTRAMKVYEAPARDVSAAEVKALLDRFSDGSSLSDWARTEAAQAVNEGLIKGRDDGRFDPEGNGTRAEAATMMSRLMKQVGIL